MQAVNSEQRAKTPAKEDVMIKNIIFDIGKVLVRFDWQDFLASFGYPQEKYDAIANAMFLSPNWILVDEGRLSYQEILELFIQDAPQYADDISQVFASFGKCIIQFPYAKPWLSSLKKEGLNLYYLSNYGSFTRENTKKELDFMELMDGGLMSYEVQLVKPNPAFYQCLFEKYQLSPQECIFIDDTAVNIKQAASLGMHTILFTDHASACRSLDEIRSAQLTVSL